MLMLMLMLFVLCLMLFMFSPSVYHCLSFYMYIIASPREVLLLGIHCLNTTDLFLFSLFVIVCRSNPTSGY